MSYYENPRISNSKLNDLKQNPERFHAIHIERSIVAKPTPEMVFGNLVHCFTFEPEKACDRYSIIPDVDRRTKQGKADWANFLETSGGKTLVEQTDFDIARRMVDAIHAHSDARAILEIEAEYEEEFYFELEGVACKSKIDLVGRSIIADLKTTADPSPEEWSKSAGWYGYHRQEAFYRIAFESYRFGVAPSDFFFIVVGKIEPYQVAVYSLDPESVEAGSIQVFSLLEEYKRRLAENDWKSDFTKRRQQIRIPFFAV